jgi:hypothetical protein
MSYSQRTIFSRQHSRSIARAELDETIPPMDPNRKQNFSRRKTILLEKRCSHFREPNH